MSSAVIDGVRYTFALPVARIIKIEEETGKPLSRLDNTFASLSALVHYAIMKDGEYLTDSEFDAFLNKISIDEFEVCLAAVMEVLRSKN